MRKERFRIVLFAVLCLATIVSIYSFRGLTKKIKRSDKGYFCDIAWGTSLNDTKSKLDSKFKTTIVETEGGALKLQVKDYEGMQGVDASILANAIDGLSSVTVTLTVNKDSKYSIKSLAKKYEDEFKEKFNSDGEKSDLQAVDIKKWTAQESSIYLEILYIETVDTYDGTDWDKVVIQSKKR